VSFTAVIQKVKEGYIGFVEELPGANTQGETIEEVRENLKEAVQLILDANKTFLQEIITGENVIREPINFTL
jgi:predicted RNase H-like HicB family nuclease